jgi:SAM-dependent methyltransferase
VAPVLVDEAELDEMAVVANNAMNRERRLRGRDSYTQELRLDPMTWLQSRAVNGNASVSWLDLCCGTGRALRDASVLERAPSRGDLTITGVDLIPVELGHHGEITFVTTTLRTWQPSRCYDLITCVHGLHYVGDKLGLLSRIATWLTNDGRFVANFDPNSVRTPDNEAAGPAVLKSLRSNGFIYDSRHRVISRHGRAIVRLPFRFLGANPLAGANYTGQPAVNAHYEPVHL